MMVSGFSSWLIQASLHDGLRALGKQEQKLQDCFEEEAWKSRSVTGHGQPRFKGWRNKLDLLM